MSVIDKNIPTCKNNKNTNNKNRSQRKKNLSCQKKHISIPAKTPWNKKIHIEWSTPDSIAARKREVGSHDDDDDDGESRGDFF